MLVHKAKFKKRLKAGQVNAVIWDNTIVDHNGDRKEFKTVSFERKYVANDGKTLSTKCLRVGDLPGAVTALKKAYESIALGA
jgi:hypothetical protein